jgi:HK97 family phage portal protein
MTFLDRTLGLVGLTRKSAPAWESSLRDIFAVGAATASAINISPLSALECPALAAALRVRVETLGSLGLFLYQRGADGERSRSTSHPLYRLLHDRPNPWTSSAKFIQQLETDVIAEGAGYAVAVRVDDGRIAELHRLDPTQVTVKIDPATQEPSYHVYQASGTTIYPWENILHIEGSISFVGKPDSRPISAIRTVRESIGLNIALRRHLARILARGAKPSGILKVAGTLTDDAYARLQRQVTNSHTGENAGGTIILEQTGAGSDFVPLTFSSVDLEFGQALIATNVDIGRALGIPPSMVFEMDRATWANSEAMFSAFKTLTLLGRCQLWQGAINRLLSPEEQETFYAEFEIDALAKANLSERFKAYQAACGGPWMTPDEVRSLDNRSSIDGGDKLRPPPNAVNVDAGGGKPKD